MSKKCFLILSLLLSSSCLFAGSIGFLSIEPILGQWILGIIIFLLGIFLFTTVITGGDYYCLRPFYAWHLDYTETILACFSCPVALSAFFIFPSTLFGLFGFVLGVIFLLPFAHHNELHTRREKTKDSSGKIKFEEYKVWSYESAPYNFGSLSQVLISILTISAGVFIAIYLPQNWWLWKYFAVALFGNLLILLMRVYKHYFYTPRFEKITLYLSILSLAFFTAFWIGFGICRSTLATWLLLGFFTLLIILLISSPLIDRVIDISIQKMLEEAEYLQELHQKILEEQEKEKIRLEQEKELENNQKKQNQDILDKTIKNLKDDISQIHDLLEQNKEVTFRNFELLYEDTLKINKALENNVILTEVDKKILNDKYDLLCVIFDEIKKDTISEPTNKLISQILESLKELC